MNNQDKMTEKAQIGTWEAWRWLGAKNSLAK